MNDDKKELVVRILVTLVVAVIVIFAGIQVTEQFRASDETLRVLSQSCMDCGINSTANASRCDVCSMVRTINSQVQT